MTKDNYFLLLSNYWFYKLCTVPKQNFPLGKIS